MSIPLTRSDLSRLAAGVMCALACCLLGCEDDSSTVDVSGSWLVEDSNGGGGTFVLAQSGTVVSGTSTSLGFSISVTGTVDENTVVFHQQSGDYVVTLAGTVTGATMQGTWQDNAGNGGTWNAVKQ